MIEKFEVTITPFQRQRLVRIYVPNDYHQSNKVYPVLYMHDGQNLYFDEEAGYGMSWRIADYLDQTGMDLIVVGIDCAPGEIRLDEYGPWPNHELWRNLNLEERVLGGQGIEYVDYLVNVLKPLIDEKYRTVPEDSSMAGSSMGGLISTYAACKYPHIFRKVASFSSAYWFNQLEIENFIRESDLSMIEKFYMDVGTKEESGSISHQMYIDSSQAVYTIIKDKVKDCRFDILEGAVHNELEWRKRVGPVFEYFFSIAT
ncbi:MULTISPECIES: alpha/beta hydrolase [unclassified Bacillus (in: firmicutes)]|uniref:alpha/beta hydrolase n=1 Tax=unclassified Bacillus (in: firmicutes) TaxID=185979 RepID=UPI0008EA225F|nr:MULTISPECIES: alpha/beta hydrolase-fold protein [unclassified Bacillus (in: firmicutes)]SFA89897.1 Predicted hydrolase of the alpha/beta superfamily [Bacillus sp. UNCCL13]SFQ85075.1 Predicted hydrolase of the alpha/beta superfamily [Bacillus sp. cl95]